MDANGAFASASIVSKETEPHPIATRRRRKAPPVPDPTNREPATITISSGFFASLNRDGRLSVVLAKLRRQKKAHCYFPLCVYAIVSSVSYETAAAGIFGNVRSNALRRYAPNEFCETPAEAPKPRSAQSSGRDRAGRDIGAACP